METISSKFPLDWTTTSMMPLLPEITKKYAYDIPLTTKVRTMGAPLFLFNKDNRNQISFDMGIDVILEDRMEKVVTFEFKNITIDFSL